MSSYLWLNLRLSQDTLERGKVPHCPFAEEEMEDIPGPTREGCGLPDGWTQS